MAAVGRARPGNHRLHVLEIHAGVEAEAGSRSRASRRLGRARRPLRRRLHRDGGDGGGGGLQGSGEEANFDSLSEDFLECTSGSHVIHASDSAGMNELWVDKHRPRSIAELAVYKKKVEEVRVWLEERINAPKVIFSLEGMHNYTLLITGQAGVGKSAVIHVISSQLEAELCEWKTPTPTLWKEHMHNSNSGVSYMSKLDEFETFVDTVRKYPVFPSTYVNGLRKPIIMLIDDLPVTNGKVAHGRLCECLRVLVCSTQVPTVILVTEYSKDDSSDVRGYMEELVSSLERAGAYKVCFNPLTVNSIKKTLSLICQKGIARLSQGDIRHAITSLQYFCLRPEQFLFSPKSKESVAHLDGNSDLTALSSLVIDIDYGSSGGVNIPFGRDETLTMFHALGKFLHNKRVNGDPSSLGMQKGVLKDGLMRLPLKMDAPEDILSQAHAQARPVVDFLHENVLDFLSDEAADDAWIIASYLSDADRLLSASFSPARAQMVKGSHGPEALSQSAATCVSVRGVLFGNSQPSTSRWHSIRRPRLWEVEQSSRRNKALMASERFELQAHCGLQTLVSIGELAAEHKPMARWLGLVRPDGPGGGVALDGGEEEEDDIQEW
ncbi:unnamed protein product [Spirodela intermedia]|uniref:Uncharacterized protein n=1 Tax=Spirodela intermedia TaxID=51605 RepID=A0A7I8J911_SPIIN|nr:unnamed protein product [Spirodela intermedia]CAA6666706.1 unnamed protein product [Spirodela intermedia]